MEPFITLDVESGSIGAMAKELNTLHDLMDTLLNHRAPRRHRWPPRSAC
ncbi:MAG: hypothetical protein ACLTG4_04890 [Oscillospiraceae bacterium]